MSGRTTIPISSEDSLKKHVAGQQRPRKRVYERSPKECQLRNWAFGGNIDYAMLVKMYGNDQAGESCRRRGAVLLLVQLREDPPDAAYEPRNGRWRDR